MFDVKVHDNLLTITDETILAVREQRSARCVKEITEIKQGLWSEYPIMNTPEYMAELEHKAQECLTDAYDKYMVFIQQCIYYQTGESVPLLS